MSEKELILQAHDLLHKGDVSGAHEVLHKLLGVDNDAPVNHRPIAHRMDFDQAFRTARRKNGVTAMYVLADTTNADGSTRVISGGNADLCRYFGSRMRGAA